MPVGGGESQILDAVEIIRGDFDETGGLVQLAADVSDVLIERVLRNVNKCGASAEQSSRCDGERAERVRLRTCQ